MESPYISKTDLFLSYDLALKLKKIGFNEPSFAYNFNPSSTQSTNVYDSPKLARNWNEHPDCVSLPLFDDVIKWFIKNKKMQGVITHAITKGGYNFDIWIIKEPNVVGKWERIPNIPSYYTYEEAQEGCLNRLIELSNEKTNNLY